MKKWTVILLLIACTGVLSGCQSTENPIANDTENTSEIISEENHFDTEQTLTESSLVVPTDISYQLKQIFMYSEEQGWALSADNEVLYTDNGIANFAPVQNMEQVSGANDEFVDICFVDPKTVYTTYLSENGELMVQYTLDGGNQWQQTIVDSQDNEIEAGGSAYISFSDAEHGYLLYCSSPAAGQMTKLLFYTDNGGETFSFESDLTHTITGYPQGITLSDNRCYIAVTYHGEPNYLYVKENGSDKWESQESLLDSDQVNYIDGYAPVFAADDKQTGMMVLKAVGKEIHYVLFTTKDGGESWEQNGEIPIDTLDYYCFISDTQLYFVTQEGTLLQVNMK